MAEKEDIIFQLKVEGSDALTEMEKFKKSIIQTKQEQQELTKAYKQGNITLDEFVQEQVRLESILKKQQSSYNNVQKSVTGVKTQLDKLIDSNKKISKSFEDTAKEIKVAGFSMNDLTAKIVSFANPATAAVGIVTALGAAYASSTVGARDFKEAQDQLSSAFSITNNEFATFLDNLTGGSGTGQGGFLSKLAFQFNKTLFGTATALKGVASANSLRQLQESEIAEIGAKRQAKDLLDQAEVLRRLRDREDLALKDRLDAANDVQQFIDERERVLVAVQEERLVSLRALQALDKENLEIKKQVKLVEFEIADIQEDSEGKRTEALNGIIKLEQKLLEVKGGSTREGRLARYESDLQREHQLFLDAQQKRNEAREQEADIISRFNDRIAKETEARIKKENANKKKSTELNADLKEQEYQAAVDLSNAVAGLAEEGSQLQQAAALLNIAVSSAEAITKGIAASQSVPFPGNLVAMASTTAAILGALASAKSVFGFAEGGWTGPGSKYQPAGIVHADEYVTPKHIVHSAAAQPHLAALESMRLRGYADGGLVTNSLTSGVNQNMMVANMMKNMPPAEISVREVTRVQNKIKAKEGN